MRFSNFAEQALGSKVKIKILMHLLSEGLLTSERELAEMLGVSHMAVNKAMRELADLNLVSPLRVGNAQAWKIKEGGYAHAVLKGLVFLAKNPPLKHLQMEIKAALGSHATASAVKKAVMFGSVAEGREVANSDIDLLVLIRDEKKEVLGSLSRLAEKCLILYGNRLSALVLTEKEAALPKYKYIMKSAEKGIVVVA